MKYLSDSSTVKIPAKKRAEGLPRERFSKLTETVTRVSSNLEARDGISSGPGHGYSKELPFPDMSRTLSEGSRKRGPVPERNIPVRDDKTCSSEISNNLNTFKSEKEDKSGVPPPRKKLKSATTLAQSEAKMRYARLSSLPFLEKQLLADCFWTSFFSSHIKQ